MRLWSLHPSYVDRQGLVACWREALLAQAVLAGRTRGYTRHPQLVRFRATPDPLAAISSYLLGVADEARARGYHFDRRRVLEPPDEGLRLEVTDGQLRYEWDQLRSRLAVRSPEWLSGVLERSPLPDAPDAGFPPPHPLFRTVPGSVADWEVSAWRGDAAR
ncbi:MAG TPA: pyrimidine dimer DNA glycosylase/endonuclease V [Segeticoccus sp.]|uniref:pyrimidine dimer DNA glycosylase/endonuclease V n=1 Tax=Segeticoccus sp. TaxID=2706531 RepID=UPI002D7E3751|nr:pyrimidine dimer DNA glycosylase/endonuclease V [Segeticoccus sp.]HET8600820.1 pyrimidine dimer DNA glycosylase/endonuclease V [Segeticoccus sp.]